MTPRVAIIINRCFIVFFSVLAAVNCALAMWAVDVGSNPVPPLLFALGCAGFCVLLLVDRP